MWEKGVMNYTRTFQRWGDRVGRGQDLKPWTYPEMYGYNSLHPCPIYIVTRIEKGTSPHDVHTQSDHFCYRRYIT